MYVRNLQDPKWNNHFQKYIHEIESLHPLNEAQWDILWNGTGENGAEDDPEITEEDIIPMCKMLEVKVDLCRSNILFTAERDWPEGIAEKRGKRYDDMSEKEKADLNGEVRKVATKNAKKTYDRKVDMVKHHQKLDAYNSPAIAFYLEDRRYKRLIAALKAASDQNNSPSASQAVDMDQHDTLDDVMDNNDNGDEEEMADDSTPSLDTVINTESVNIEQSQNNQRKISFNMDTEDDDQHGDNANDDDATDSNRLVIDGTGERFIELPTNTLTVGTSTRATTDATHSQQMAISNLGVDSEEMIPGFDPQADSDSIKFCSVKLERLQREDFNGNNSNTYSQFVAAPNYVSSTQQE